MFGDQVKVTTGTASAYQTFEELKKQVFGTSTALNGNPIPDVDDRLGYRIGQSRALQTTRIPKLTLVVKCDNGTLTNQPLEKDLVSEVGNMIHNVTSIGMSKVHITGITGNHPNLFISIWDANARHALRTGSNLMLGFSSLRNQGIVLEGNPVGTEVLVNPGAEYLLASFMKPQEVDHLSISLQDMNGRPVAYTQMILWLECETEIWQ